MADSDGTAALVVALSAQLTKFESDMKRAGDIADRGVSDIEGKFSKLNPTFAGSFLGNLLGNISSKGLDAAVSAVEDLVSRFKDLNQVANLVQVSMNEVFGIQQAASTFRVPVDEATTSVKALAVLLDQMQRGQKNSLSDLFDANPDALKGINRDALTLQQTFSVVADLVQNARTEIQKVDLAKAAGQAESMVKFLEQGGEQVTYLSQQAAQAAPDLQKLADQAKAFDDAWRTAVTNLKAYLSEHIFDIFAQDLKDVIALLGGAVNALRLFRGGLIDSSTQPAADQLDKFRQSLIRLQLQREQMDESAGLDTSANARDDRRTFYGPLNGDTSAPRQNGTSTANRDRALSNVPLPDTGEDNDAVDRAINQLNKHTQQTVADANAVGLGAEALARFRAEAAETAAVQANGGKETTEQAARFKELQDQAAAAAEALAKAKVANDISRGQQTALLSPEDVQIANQLKDVYPDVATALGSVEASALRANQALSSVSSSISSDLASGLTDITTGTKSLSDGFSSMSASIIKDIEQMIIKLTVVQPLMASLQSAFGGGLNVLSGSLNPLSGLTGHADGGLITGPGGPRSDGIVTRVSPGEFIVNAASTSQHRQLLEAINSGNIQGFADGGMVGSVPSIPTPAGRSSGGVTIVNQTGVQANAETKTAPNGEMTIVLKKMVDQAVGDSLSTGTGRRVLGSQYGVKQFTGQ